MAQYSLDKLHGEYMGLWGAMVYKPGVERMAEKVAARLLTYLPRYLALQELSGVPAAFIMCAHERESGGNFETYLGNGQSLHRVTTIVPAGRGPFNTFEEGALDAFKLEKLIGIRLADWDEAMLCWWLEKFNGFGYRGRGLRSPYLWGGTNQQQPGKYVADNVFDPNFMDPQLGGMAVYGQIVKQHPELDLGGPAGGPLFLRTAAATELIPSPQVRAVLERGGVKLLQASLVALGFDPGPVDGWIGDRTDAAVDALSKMIKSMLAK